VSRLRKAGVGLTAAGALAVATVGAFEGLELEAYRDPVGIVTACYGETKGIRMGMRFTKAQCDAMLEDSLVAHEPSLVRCIPRAETLPVETYVGLLSWVYNTGEAKCLKSTLRRKANAGDIRGACNELPRWVFAAGIKFRGLVIRRNKERALCLKGVAS
jgi:lysozyme